MKIKRNTKEKEEVEVMIDQGIWVHHLVTLIIITQDNKEVEMISK
jgi:hypothetical protein